MSGLTESFSAPTRTTGTRWPSLDGLRALSILLVVFSHCVGNEGFHGPAWLMAKPFAWGNLGVRIFFGISGFLITSLLLKEHANSGIRLGRFYLRRAFRIFPVFYCYLAVIWLLSRSGLANLYHFDLLEAATYTVNCFRAATQSQLVRHIWSLSIEEQYYLLWPVLLPCFLGKDHRKWWLVALLALIPAWKLVVFHADPTSYIVERRLDGNADALLTSSLLAIIRFRLHRSQRYLGFIRSRAFWLIPAVVLICSRFGAHPTINYGLAQTLMNVGIAISIDRFVTFPSGIAAFILNAGPVAWLGRISYSLYVWQQLFLRSHPSPYWPLLQHFPLNVTAALACAVLSYYLWELPWLRLRDRMLKRRGKTFAPASRHGANIAGAVPHAMNSAA